MPQYTVVLRASSAVQFPFDEAVRLSPVNSDFGPVDVAFSSHWAQMPAANLPVGVHAVVTGPAPDLQAAVRAFNPVAQGMMPALTLVTNATTENLMPELAYASDDGLTERDFFQQYTGKISILPLQRRLVNPDHVVAVLRAVATSPWRDRVHRALAHYHFALQHWTPGSEILAAHSLWVGIECMTPVVRSAFLAARQVTLDGLMTEWGITDGELVGPEVRRRLIFKDDVVYKQAKGMADGYEHSFLQLPDVRTSAVTLRSAMATILRRTIVAHLGFAADMEAVLLSLSTSTPLDLTIQRHLRCRLYCPGLAVDGLGEEGQLYPRFKWETKYRPVFEGGKATLEFSDETKPAFAPGVHILRDGASITLVTGERRVEVPITEVDNAPAASATAAPSPAPPPVP